MFLKHTVSKSTVKTLLFIIIMFFFKYSLQIWYGYTMESPLNSNIDSLAYVFFDAMLELFKSVVERFTYACISL